MGVNNVHSMVGRRIATLESSDTCESGDSAKDKFELFVNSPYKVSAWVLISASVSFDNKSHLLFQLSCHLRGKAQKVNIELVMTPRKSRDHLQTSPG